MQRSAAEGFIPPHGGYEGLLTYRKAVVIFRATFHLAAKWVRLGSRTRDQMEQSARSTKQNIVEGSLASATSKSTEIRLTNVARASLGELLEDYRDFLMLRDLPIWSKDDPRALALRRLGTDSGDGTIGTDATYETYRKHIESPDAEIVGNLMVVLCTQTCYLLDRQIRRLERDFVEHGGIRERMLAARLRARGQDPPDAQRAAEGPPPPVCPQCGALMRLRTARTGANAGSQFWGCSTYPACKGTRSAPTTP